MLTISIAAERASSRADHPAGRSAISCPGNRQHAPLKLPDRIRRSLARNKGESGVPLRRPRDDRVSFLLPGEPEKR